MGAVSDEAQGTIVRLPSQRVWPRGEGAALPVRADELPEPGLQSLESPDSPAYMLTPKRFSHLGPKPTTAKHARILKRPAARHIAKPSSPRVAANSLLPFQ